jgi:nitrogen fixation NifU-like protein
MDEEHIKKEMIDLLMEKVTGGFSQKVVDYGNNPRNYKTMDNPDGYAKITGPCGDTMEMFLRIKDDKIEDISYTTDGCLTSHAAGSAATVMAKGKPVRECIKINQTSILEHLNGMHAESEHCALLAAKTFHKALRDYAVEKKRDDTSEVYGECIGK